MVWGGEDEAKDWVNKWISPELYGKSWKAGHLASNGSRQVESWAIRQCCAAKAAATSESRILGNATLAAAAMQD